MFSPVSRSVGKQRQGVQLDPTIKSCSPSFPSPILFYWPFSFVLATLFASSIWLCFELLSPATEPAPQPALLRLWPENFFIIIWLYLFLFPSLRVVMEQ